jgi:hypothetical protein
MTNQKGKDKSPHASRSLRCTGSYRFYLMFALIRFVLMQSPDDAADDLGHADDACQCGAS